MHNKEKKWEIAKKFNVTQSTITRINKNKEKIISDLSNRPKYKKVKSSLHDSVDFDLLHWFRIERPQGILISILMLIKKLVN